MKINWNKNPLKTTVDLDLYDKEKLLFYIKKVEYEHMICGLDLWMSRKIRKNDEVTLEEVHKKIKAWGEICTMNVDHEEVQFLVEALQHAHSGDCTCLPASCEKCIAESALGIDTIKGMTKHVGHEIAGAFGLNDDKSIEDVITYLQTKKYVYENRHKSWEKYSREEYEKNYSHWYEYQKSALKWIQNYKEEHKL